MNRTIRFLIPNLLSFSRLVIALVFPLAPESLRLWLILAGGATDGLDGFLARSWQVTSWQGGLLDAIADKLFVLSALATLAVSGVFSPWWIPAIVIRDLTVACIAAYAALIRSWKSFQEMEVRWSGKLATGSQFLFLVLVVLRPGWIEVVLWPVILCSVFAAWDYGRLFFHRLQR